MFCKYCGQQIDEDSTFCKFCGKNLISKTTDEVLFDIDWGDEDKSSKIDSAQSVIDCIKNLKALSELSDDEDLNNVNTIKFGKYFISDEKGDKKEDIEWYVLAKDSSKALLMSKYILDYIKFDSNFDYKSVDYTKDNIIYWKDCTLRNWLNTTFYDLAFNESEKKSILEIELQNSPHTVKHNTKDKIFCLSLEECKIYMKNKRLANRLVSAYASAKDGEYHYLNEETGMGHYRLRNVYDTSYPSAGYVDCDDNDYSNFSCGGDDPNIGICPAMWIKIK